MPGSKSLFVKFTAIIILWGGLPAEVFASDVAPDFSFFETPSGSSGSDTKAKTEAEPPCISCNTSRPLPKIQEDLEQIAQKVQVPNKGTQKPEKKQAECITCGRVTLDGPVKTGKKAQLGAELWKQFPQIASYSDSNAVKKMISYAERHSHRNSLGMCYRYVKEALCGAPKPRCQKGSLVRSYLVGNPVFADRPSRVPRSKRAGVNAIRTLKSEGFVNLLEDPKTNALIKNPASAPKGAIMIYSGGNNGGHIEIKTGHGTSGSYISDFRAPNSVMQNELAGRASKRYKLVGVMIKPAEKL